jgi:hypothetical protein
LPSSLRFFFSWPDLPASGLESVITTGGLP